MKLKYLFDQWGHKAEASYKSKQWLLSKWELNEGIEWGPQKTEALLRTLMAGLSPRKKDTLIELGCAGGWILEMLAPKVKAHYGLDFSMAMLKFASAQLKKGHLICGEIGALPLGTGSFDRVLSYYVFMNFDDDDYVRRSIKEIMRILKPGGRALIGQLPERDGSARYEAAKEGYIRFCEKHYKVGKSIREEFKPPLRLFSKKELGEFLRKEGIGHTFRDSFNPFFRAGEADTVDWRFDLILEK